jgi:hypothetical protein
MLKCELQGQKFSTDTEAKQATTADVCKMSKNGLLQVFEKWVRHSKKCIACEECYCKKETGPKHHKSSGNG